MLLDLAASTCERYWPVVASLEFLPFFENCSDICCSPVLRYIAGIQAFLKYSCQKWRDFTGSFSTLAGNRSGPQAFPGLSFCNNFCTPSHVTLISGIDGKGVPSGVGMLLLSSFVQVDSY